MKLPFPQNTRELFAAFQHFDPVVGLGSVLEEINFANVQPRQVYFSVLGRLPESAWPTIPRPDYDPREHFRSALESQEFQTNAVRLFLQAFPDRKRLIFIHIPKCAGSHLYLRLRTRYAALPATLGQEAWTPKQELFAKLRSLVSGDGQDGPIFTFGHVPLSWYIRNDLLRPTDAVFTVVRNPLALLLSHANYVVTRLLDDPGFSTPDTKHWAHLLDVEFGQPTRDPVALVRQVLRDPTIMHRNSLCQYLGFSDAKSAIDTVIRTNAEITDVDRYDEWFSAKWDIPLGPRENRSRKLLKRDDLDADDLRRLEEMMREDQVFYSQVSAALNSTTSPSIFGDSWPMPIDVAASP